MTVHTEKPQRTGRKRLLLAAGAGVGVIALITAAAFTDFANLNLGTDGLGASSYNIQVVSTDSKTGEQHPGEWQEANTPEGAPIQIVGADTLYPGGPAVSVKIPIRNASKTLSSTLEVKVAQLVDVGPKKTDPDYRSSLRFNIDQPETRIDGDRIAFDNLTFEEASKVLTLNRLAAGEETDVVVTVTLLDQKASGAKYTDNSLNGKKAYLQAEFTGSSIN